MARVIENVTTIEDLNTQLQQDPDVAAIVADERITKDVLLRTAPWMFASADTAYAGYQHKDGNKFVFLSIFQYKGRLAMAAKFVSAPGSEGDDGWMMTVAPRTYTSDKAHRFFDGIVRSIGVEGEWAIHQDGDPSRN